MRILSRIVATLCLCLPPITLAAQSSYSNKVYGISLRFPDGYKLHRGELRNDYSLGYLGAIPMEFAAPEGERLATVEMPADLYPNTDFNAAFVTVSVNRYLTREECDPLAGGLPKSQKALTLKIDGLEFHGAEEGDGGLGHQFWGAYYHSFLEGTCYELGEGIATSGYGAVDGMQKLDGKQVTAILDGILRSVTIDAPPPTFKIAPPPSIRSFAMSPLPKSSPGMRYRLSWDVSGANADQIWLSATCSGGLSIFELASDIPNGPTLLCDVLRPTQSTHGSLDIEIRNESGGEAEETLRLFARGRENASRTLTTQVLSLPVLISVGGYGVYPGAPDSTVMQFFAGHAIKISGVAFLPHQTLWLGSAALPVESADGNTITFSVPETMPVGQYHLFVENERGRSNVVTVQIVK